MLRVASFFFWSHRSHFQKFASAPGFINDRAVEQVSQPFFSARSKPPLSRSDGFAG
jgi:hypothetical protein